MKYNYHNFLSFGLIFVDMDCLSLYILTVAGYLFQVGDAKDNVRKDVRNIFKLICKVYPASKMFTYLLDGLKCKVAKQRAGMIYVHINNKSYVVPGFNQNLLCTTDIHIMDMYLCCCLLAKTSS